MLPVTWVAVSVILLTCVKVFAALVAEVFAFVAAASACCLAVWLWFALAAEFPALTSDWAAQLFAEFSLFCAANSALLASVSDNFAAWAAWFTLIIALSLASFTLPIADSLASPI